VKTKSGNATTAFLREDKIKLGLSCPSLAVEYNTRCALALTTSLSNGSKHCLKTRALPDPTAEENSQARQYTSLNPPSPHETAEPNAQN